MSIGQLYQEGSIVDVDADPFGKTIYTYVSAEGKRESFSSPTLFDGRGDIPGHFVHTHFGARGYQEHFNVFMETRYPGKPQTIRESVEAKTREEAIEIVMRKHGVVAAVYAGVDLQRFYDILLLRRGLFLRRGN